ncbi:MAG: hypothetical protein WBF33_18150 [Candidatus Nitrosopolaris sp.]|jgi:hypothetical protein
MDKKIERLITAGMIAGLVAIFFYQVAYGVESDGYPIAQNDKYGRTIITYQTGFQAGKQDSLNAVADIGVHLQLMTQNVHKDAKMDTTRLVI